MRVSLANFDRSFSVAAGQSVLDAAVGAGLNLPHSCKGGNCGACRALLIAGHVNYPKGRPLGLSDAEVEAGYILLCQAHASHDLIIEAADIRSPDDVTLKRLPCRIERVEAWTHDVVGAFLRLPAAECLTFKPGQYIDVLLPGRRRRSFSIASPPHDSCLLELHIRRVAGGEFTEPLFTGDMRSALLSIEGPLGSFVYRHSPDRAAILVGGGTGLAPLKSMLRHVIENDRRRPVMLYWGVRCEEDLYAHAYLVGLAQRAPYLSYEPVLSEPSPTWRGRRGLVHEAVLQDFPRLDAVDIYASGPPGMIAAVRRDFALRGAAPQRLYFDSFDYAPDALERQRAAASNKS